MIVALVAAYSFLAFHMYDLQLVKGNYYLAQVKAELFSPNFVKANRGAIYFMDKNGNPLPAVLNKDFPVVYAVPKAIEDAAETANALSPLLNKPVAELEKGFSQKNDSYELLRRKADSDLAQKISDLNIKGIYVDTESGRFYPLGAVGSHMLGFVGPNGGDSGENGHYGLEEFYDQQLSGVAGKIFDGKIIKPLAGRDLILTVDPNIQIEASRLLNDIVTQYKATGGSVIVEDPQTGKILAMDSSPTFDPNSYNLSPISNFTNPVTQKLYEPGSVFKIVTMAAGIDSGKIAPDTTYFDTGTITLNGRTISNHDYKTHGGYGRITMTNVIENSLNVGAAFAQRQMGRDIFAAYVKSFGFSEKTGISLPGEIGGDIKRLNPKERDIAFATASYGQGVAVTPLELIAAISAIANGGNLMRPYIDASLAAVTIRKVISQETARKVAGMMISAVDKADVAKISGFSIAGKSGTAYVPDFERGGYTNDVINTYVGFGPVSNPRFVILIKLDKPLGAPLAGISVVPYFRDLAQFILNYYGLQPDRLQEKM